MRKDGTEETSWKIYLPSLVHNISKCKKWVSVVSRAQSKTGLYRLRFHLLAHSTESVNLFTGLDLPESSIFEYFHEKSKSVYRKTLRRHSSSVIKTSCVMGK